MSNNQQETHNERASTKVEFLAGLGSAFLTITITYPITKLIYRQILEHSSARRSLNTLRTEGLRVLYRGALLPMLQRGVELSSMFGIYRMMTVPLERFQMNEYLEIVCACSLSGTFESFFMPLERVQLLLVSRDYNHKFKNILHAVKIIGKDYSLKEFYRGYHIVLFRNIGSNSCFFITREVVHKRVDFSDIASNQNVQHFMLGSALGTVMTLLFYPVKVIKVNIQKQLGGRFRGVKEVMQEIYAINGQGLYNFYRGVIINGGRALISWGITNSSYEYIKKRIS